MKLVLCLIAAAYLVGDVCVWHGPVDRLIDQAFPSASIVAVVGGQAITANDVDRATQEDAFRHGINVSDLDQPARDKIKKQILGRLVDAALVRAARLKDAHPLRPSTATTEELRLFIKQFPQDTEYPERLALQHLTEGQLRDRMQSTQDDQAWIEKQIEPQLADIAEAEARTWYLDHKAELTIPPSFHAAHLFLSGHEKNEKDNPDHTADILALHQKLMAGTVTFEALVSTASEDERTKTKGGDLGWFTKNRMPTDFMAAVTALSQGQLSGPVHTSLGWHVTKLIEKKPAHLPAFEEVRGEIMEELRNHRRNEAVRALMARLRNDNNK